VAMLYDGMLCPLCGRELFDGQPFEVFAMLGIEDAAAADLDDGAAHAACLRGWSLRDRFVAGYNAAAQRCGWGERLAVSAAGAVVRQAQDAGSGTSE
jgi:hypothetical protein